jgi:hypothetical protein
MMMVTVTMTVVTVMVLEHECKWRTLWGQWEGKVGYRGARKIEVHFVRASRQHSKTCQTLRKEGGGKEEMEL